MVKPFERVKKLGVQARSLIGVNQRDDFVLRVKLDLNTLDKQWMVYTRILSGLEVHRGSHKLFCIRIALKLSANIVKLLIQLIGNLRDVVLSDPFIAIDTPRLIVFYAPSALLESLVKRRGALRELIIGKLKSNFTGRGIPTKLKPLFKRDVRLRARPGICLLNTKQRTIEAFVSSHELLNIRIVEARFHGKVFEVFVGINICRGLITELGILLQELK